MKLWFFSSCELSNYTPYIFLCDSLSYFLADDFLIDTTPVSYQSPKDSCLATGCPYEEPETVKERSSDTLWMCIITTLNQGLRNGGGIGDVLRPPSSTEPFYTLRLIYDMLFFFVVIIIVLNLIFGVIIDTFADLRSEKQNKEEVIKNTCFICGLERKVGGATDCILSANP